MVKYIYTPNVLLEFVLDYIQKGKFKKFNTSLKPEEMPLDYIGKPTTHNINSFVDDLKDELFFIMPNPTSSFKLLVYSPENSEKAYYQVYNNSRKLHSSLKKGYKETMKEKGLTDLYKVLNYDKLIKTLYEYEEESINNHFVLLNDGIVYDNKNMEFIKNINDIPMKSIKKDYHKLTEDNKDLLGEIFNIMYPDVKEYDKFLYYILSMSDKSNATQSIFLVVDPSGTGKSAKINPLAELEVNNTANSNLLKGTELYNLLFMNAVTINEAQGDTIDGSILNNLADGTSITVTRKNKDSLTVEGENKPVLTIMGETQPFIKSLSDGTNRRFVLVPKVSKQFLEFKSKKENKEKIDKFYNLLYGSATEVIEFYSQQIDIHNIKERINDIKESMLVSPDELEQLIEVKEDIFNTYFNTNPEYNNALTETTYLIDSDKGLKRVLKYIDNNIVTVNHIGTDNGRKKYLNQLIKNETGEKNLKNFGITKASKKNNQYNLYYAYSLTEKGVKLVEKLNKELYPDEQIYIKEVKPL